MRSMQPIRLQQQFWNDWNARTRERSLGEISLAQADVVERWLKRLDDEPLDIIDVGCGTGWLSERLTAHGNVTGTDLADEVVDRAKQRVPSASFVAGDFLEMEFGSRQFDVVVCLEVLSHVPDQGRFVERVARLLRPGGSLILATQNRRALERNRIPDPAAGQLRRWVDRHELRMLLEPEFDVIELISITPTFNRGVLRIINSSTVERWAARVHVSFLEQGVKRLEEKAFLGWSLMTLCRRRGRGS